MSNQKLIILAAVLVSLVGCTNKTSQTGDVQAKVVNLAIWGNYIEPETVKKFESATGIKVNISNYASNEELLAKVQAGDIGVDVAVPSDYMVAIMTKTDLLEPLDKTKIPNANGVSPELLGQSYDPENKYSLPYCWSTAGIAVNTKLVKTKITSWKDVFENKELAGKISMLDDVREVTGAALKMNGFSVNSTKPEELKKAEATLAKIKPKVKMFNSDVGDSLINKEVAIAHAYSTDALRAAARSNGDIAYILPAEGGTRAIDNLVVFKNSQHKEAAFALINYVLSPEVNESFVKFMWGGPVLKTTRERLPENYKNNTAIFPPQKLLSHFEAIHDVGDATKAYDDLWTRVKTE